MTLRNVLAVSILLLLSTTTPVDSQNLKVGYPSIGGAQTPLFVAKESGAFRRQGLNVETIFIAGGNRVVQAMIAGDIQFGQVSQAPAISASLAGADLVFIANLYPTLVYSLWVAPEIKRPADLKGKKLGVTSFGSVIDFGTRLFLKKFNLIPDRDVALIQVGGQTNAVAALAAKAIQGGLLNPPASIEAKKLGAQELFDLRELGVDYAFVGVAVSRAYWTRNPDIGRKIYQSLRRGNKHRQERSRANHTGFGKIYEGRSDQRELAETYRVFVANALLDKPYTTDQGIQANLDGLAPKLKAAQNAKPQTFYDNQIIDKLEKSGYIKSLYQ